MFLKFCSVLDLDWYLFGFAFVVDILQSQSHQSLNSGHIYNLRKRVLDLFFDPKMY